MTEAVAEIQRLSGYALLFMGFILLFVNHLSVVAGDPWLIPEFLKLQ
ncbi:MAG: hypothetical protein ABW098_09440 [Candidatus Thiodiazotropha sp.]